MATHPIITGCLLGIAVLICFLCALGLAVMRDPYQRLHFATPIVSISITLIVVAIWIEDGQWQSRIKAVMVALILFFMNSILSHATARAIRIRKLEHWPVSPDEHMPLVEDHGEVGAEKRPPRKKR
jgi:monovalent cation/proton antiporter MnhG/PhaG subunit